MKIALMLDIDVVVEEGENPPPDPALIDSLRSVLEFSSASEAIADGLAGAGYDVESVKLSIYEEVNQP